MTIVLEYDHKSFSAVSQRYMEEETSALLKSAGLNVEWATRAQAEGKLDMTELVLFKMRGKCAMDAMPVLADELGMPFALTHSSDGQLLSFGEVDCNRVRNATKAGMTDYGKAEAVYGRALGRVLAHEVYHMLSRSKSHSGKGVSRECLSPRELVAEELEFPGESLDAIRTQIGLLKARRDSSGVPSNVTLP